MKNTILILISLLVFTGVIEGKEVTYLQDRSGIKYEVDSKVGFTGKYVQWYENGQKKSEENYKYGKLDGLSTLWYENGQKEIKGNYKGGLPAGLWTGWNENGRKEFERNWKDGIQDGLSTKWYEDGFNKHGFTSEKEMVLFHSYGYSTYFDYEEAKKRTPEWFIGHCTNNPNYMHDCFGRRVIWYGIVDSIGTNSVRIDVKGDRGVSLKASEPSDPFTPSLRVDSKSLKRDWGVKKNQLIEFHGKIDKENTLFPDIEAIAHVRFESAEDQKRRDNRLIEKRAERKKKVKKRYLESSVFNWQDFDYRGGIIASGKTCTKATKKELTMESKGDRFVSVLCADGGSFMVWIPKKTTDKVRVLDCSLVKAVTGVECFG